MRKFVFILVLVLCLAGCADAPVMETVADGIVQPVAAEPKEMFVWLPEEAAAQTMADGQTGECYTWGDCEVRIQTLTGGDIRATLRSLTGLDPEKLTVMEYERDGLQLYQTVWSMTGEEGVPWAGAWWPMTEPITTASSWSALRMPMWGRPTLRSVPA